MNVESNLPFPDQEPSKCCETETEDALTAGICPKLLSCTWALSSGVTVHLAGDAERNPAYPLFLREPRVTIFKRPH